MKWGIDPPISAYNGVQEISFLEPWTEEERKTSSWIFHLKMSITGGAPLSLKKANNNPPKRNSSTKPQFPQIWAHNKESQNT